jgi:hypothetical protein
VPGCTSQGNAVNKNPHCGAGNEPPPPCEVNCGPPPCEVNCSPPPPGGCVMNCGGPTTTTTGVVVAALPSTGAGTEATQRGNSLLWLLLAAGSSLAAGISIQRRSLR